MVHALDFLRVQNSAPAFPTAPLGRMSRRVSAETPSGIDTPPARQVDSLSRLVAGHWPFQSARAKAEGVLRSVYAVPLSEEARNRLQDAFDNHPETLRRLLHHAAADCDGSAGERALNRALLLRDVAEMGLGSNRENIGELFNKKELYKFLGEADRADLVQQPSGEGRERIESWLQKLYSEAGIPWRDDTRPLIISNTLEWLDFGNFNEVYLSEVETPDGIREVVIKPLTEESAKQQYVGGVSATLEIKPPGNFAIRNIVTSLIAEALGFDVVTPTRIGIYKSPDNGTDQVGIVMERAQGIRARAWSVVDLIDKEISGGIQRELTKLQILDAIVGQGDRHMGNIFIESRRGSRVITVRGIDNDQCLGRWPTDPNDLALREIDGELTFLKGVRLPQVIDTEMRNAVNDLTDERLREILAGKIRPDECDAAVARLRAVREHICADEGIVVIAPAEWDNPEVLYGLVNKTNSYFKRAVEPALERFIG